MAAVIKIKDENGNWKSVPVVAEGGSSAEPFVVTFSLNENPSAPSNLFLCDKTSEDIIAAHNVGKDIWFVLSQDENVLTVQKDYSVIGTIVFVNVKYILFGSLTADYAISINGDSLNIEISGTTFLWHESSDNSIYSELAMGYAGVPTYLHYNISSDANVALSIGSTQPCYTLITNNTSSDCDITINNGYYADVYALMTQQPTFIDTIILPEEGITIPANSSVELSSVYNKEKNVVILTYSTRLTKITLNE